MGAESNHAKLKFVRFGPFRFCPATGELARAGARVSLQDTPARLLAELIANPESLCTREELRARLWPGDLHLDFENNLNNAIARLRQALGESADYIETIRRRGYRFNGAVTEESPSGTIGTASQALRKGRHFRNRTTVRDLWRAIGYFEQAIRAEPGSADGYAALSDSYVLLGDDILGGMPASEALPRAETAAQRALALDPQCATAHTSLAMIEWRLRWDWIAAEDRFRQSLAIDSTNASTWQYYSWLLAASARANESRGAMYRALELAPDSPFVSANVGWMLYLERRYSDALAQLGETIELDDCYPLARLPLGYVLQQSGQMDEALAHFRFGLERSGDSFYRAAYAQALVRAGLSDNAAAILQSLGVTPYHQAMVQAALGQDEDTLGSLESAVADHSTSVPFLGVDPLFDRVRGCRRFRNITEEIGIAG